MQRGARQESSRMDLANTAILARAWAHVGLLRRLRHFDAAACACREYGVAYHADTNARATWGQWPRALAFYLVDPASSHMLVSKVKPCMSEYKLLYGNTANGSLKQL